MMVPIPAGAIELIDEGSRPRWRVPVASFLLSPHVVARAGAPCRGFGGAIPVTDVSWLDAVRFCNTRSREEGLALCYAGLDGADASPAAMGVTCDFSANGYRLPTEAEWEHACRAGSTAVRYGDLDDIAWHRGDSGDRIQPIGGKRPNAWGLFDTIGNAWEWCWDLYDPAVYGPYRVFRGGGFADLPRGCRASCRRKSHPTFKVEDLGFRLARSHT